MFLKIKSFLFENTSDKQIILKNTFWLILAEFMSKWSMFFITILIARILWPEEFGKLSFVTSFVAMFIVLTDFWLTTLMVREVSRDQSLLPSYLVNLSFLKVILWILTFIIIYIISQYIWKDDFYITLILIYTWYAIFNNIWEFLRAFFRPSEAMQYEALLKIINGILMLIIVWWILIYYWDLQSILTGYLIVSAISLIISLLYILKTSKNINSKVSFTMIKPAIVQWLYLWWSMFFVNIFVNIDRIILWIYNFETDLWIYSSMLLLTSIPLLVLTLYTNSSIPRILKKNNLYYTYLIWRRVLFASITISIFMILFSSYIIKIFWKDYSSWSVIFIILSITFVFASINAYFYTILNSYGEEKKVFLTSALIALINTWLNIIIVPHFKWVWVALTTLLSEIILISVFIVYFRTRLSSKYISDTP